MFNLDPLLDSYEIEFWSTVVKLKDFYFYVGYMALTCNDVPINEGDIGWGLVSFSF